MQAGRQALKVFAGFSLSILLACSSGSSKEKEAERSDYLDMDVPAIIKDGLSTRPSASFKAVRSKVSRDVEPTALKELGRLDFAETSGEDFVKDATLLTARKTTARALGTSLDADKADDAEGAAATIDTFLDELSERFDGATRCADLASEKQVDCVIALLVAEVRRSEKGGAPEDEPGTDAGEDVAPDAGGKVDAGTDAGRTQGTDAGTALLGCDTRDVSTATNVTAVDTDQTWRGLILLTGAVRVRNAALTIEPGTVILMSAGAMLDVGYNGAAASIYANGTKEQPIRFCGRNPNAGFWNSLVIQASVSNDSVLSHVLVSDAGSSNAALVLNAGVTLDDVQVRNSGKDGVLATDFGSRSSALTVEGSLANAVVLTSINAAAHLPTTVTLRDNMDNSVRLRFSVYNQDLTLRNLGVPYVQEQVLRLSAGTLTLEAGVELRVGPGLWIDFGYNNAVATLHVNGSEAQPVTFSGVSARAGGWNGIHVWPTVAAGSNLTNVRIKHSGGDAGNRGALLLDAPITLDHVQIDESAAGARVAALGFGSASRALVVTGITDVAQRPLTVVPDALVSIPPESHFVGNATSQVQVLGGYYSKVGTVPRLDVPYFIAANLRTSASSDLTIAPGAEFVVNADVSIDIGYNNVAGAKIVAVGTAEAPIKFTGIDPTAGSWYHLSLWPNVASSSVLRYVEIGHAGGDTNGPGALYTDVTIPIESCRIYDSAGWGIVKRTTNPTDYASQNTFQNVVSGAVTTR